MTYTFCGNKDYIDIEIKKIKEDFSENNISIYDMGECEIEDALCDLNTLGLFGQKLVIVYNFEKQDNYDCLIKYLDFESDNILVLISYKALDNRTKISKILKKKSKYEELFDYDFATFIRENIDDYMMSNMAINTLITYTGSNINRIYNELEKLKIYKMDDKKITEDDIKKLVKRDLESSIFDLINNISNKNRSEIIKIYNELLEEGETSEKILYTLANNYRLLLQIKLKSEKCSDKEIQEEYKMHPYRFAKLKEQAFCFSTLDILKILKDLSEIDLGIKSGKLDTDNGMVLFFEKI